MLMLARKRATYGRDNKKQAEMLYFHCGPSRQENVLIRLDQNEQN